MLKTNLLICGLCEQQGIREIVGEVDTTGAVLVQRFHRGYTKIIGNFSIICGRCGNGIFFRNTPEISWVHHIISDTLGTRNSILQGSIQ